MTCTATVGDVSVTVIGDLLPEKADNRGISEEFVILQMSKLGGTIFSAGRVDVELEPDLFVSSKSMNELRRKAIESVIEKYDKSP
jgi:putative protease